MEYINRDRELVGFDIDLLREIGLRAGFRPVFETVAWDGIFAGLAARQYDMIASSVTLLEERKRAMLFSEPYFEAAQHIVVREEDAGIQELGELSGQAVGAQIATTGSRLVAATPGVELRAYDDLGLAVEDLATGRLAAIVADMAIVEYFVLGNERYAEDLSVTGPPYAVEDYAFAVRLDRPELRDAINEGLREVRGDGTLEALRDFWFQHVFR
jgi:polar amino acid transport system substrate-binding protein